MKIRKYIFALILITVLSFSFQPGASFREFNESNVISLDVRKDDAVRDFIEKNEKKRFTELVSITLRCVFEENNFVYNTS